MNDIAADDYKTGSWNPIGGKVTSQYDYGIAYEGTFDGCNHTVSNATCVYADTMHYIGFFGACKNATIKNLKLANCEVSGGYYVGGICGYNGGIVEKYANTGNISASHDFESKCGGIVGENFNGKSILNCWNSGKVTSENGSGESAVETATLQALLTAIITERCPKTPSVVLWLG